ncbi:hypothetical protein, partial [Vibrio sp. Vb0592]|uniref:hypothetical protein n=1 Tax=Vibrio sp. Vb0592 TaxID=2816072 RepID=UPI00391B0E53
MTSRMIHSLYVKPEPLTKRLGVHTPLGLIIMVNTVYQDSFIKIDEVELLADLIQLELDEFDVILGMNWLIRHRAK